MSLKFETIVNFFRNIIQLNAVTILKSTNEYYRKIISKSGLKMDLYPAMLAVKLQYDSFKGEIDSHVAQLTLF